MAEIGLAILAKAPVPGFAKTRLSPLLGDAGAARLQERLIGRAVATGLASGLDPVTLWCAPDADHAAFAGLQAPALRLARQPEGSLGARMLAAFAADPGRPLVLIGTDCPVLGPGDLVEAASALAGGADLVLAPAEDGGYGLIGLRGPAPFLFSDMPWSTDRVAALTLERAWAANLRIVLLPPVWDVDTPADYRRLVASRLLDGP